VVKGHRRTIRVKQLLCSQRGQSAINAEASTPFQFSFQQRSELSCRIILSALNSSRIQKFCYQSVCSFIRYFLVRMRVDKCFVSISSFDVKEF
jgi:hypothetical protein